jgi:transcription antitermination factor NusG
MLSPRALTVPGIGGTWCAVRCRSRCEKVLAASLLEAGFDYFLPLVKHVDKYRRASYSPIQFLRGLVFASSQDTPEPGYAVPTALHYFLRAHHAFYGLIVVSAASQRQFQAELERIYGDIVNKRITSDTYLSESFAVVGQVCKVRDGLYQGQKVTIDRVISSARVEVEIVTMGDRRPLEIDVEHLEPVAAA